MWSLTLQVSLQLRTLHHGRITMGARCSCDPCQEEELPVRVLEPWHDIFEGHFFNFFSDFMDVFIHTDKLRNSMPPSIGRSQRRDTRNLLLCWFFLWSKDWAYEPKTKDVFKRFFRVKSQHLHLLQVGLCISGGGLSSACAVAGGLGTAVAFKSCLWNFVVARNFVSQSFLKLFFKHHSTIHICAGTLRALEHLNLAKEFTQLSVVGGSAWATAAYVSLGWQVTGKVKDVEICEQGNILTSLRGLALLVPYICWVLQRILRRSA